MKYIKNNFKDDDNYAWGNLAYENWYEYCIQKFLRAGATDEFLDEFTLGWNNRKNNTNQT